MKTILIVTLLCLATTAFALDDTQANRAKQADRYLEVSSPVDLMKDMADKMAINLPPEKRAAFKDLMMKHLDMAAVTKGIKDAMVKHLTADELKALADFYGSPVGKSAMKKLGIFMADAMPVIRSEVVKAHEKVLKAQAEGSSPR